MLDTADKLLEKFIRGGLAGVIHASGDLSPRQFGFRTERSTVDAVMDDVRNAFNSIKWTDMLGTLENSFHVPSYLLWILRDYLKDRFLLDETLDGQRRIDTCSTSDVISIRRK